MVRHTGHVLKPLFSNHNISCRFFLVELKYCMSYSWKINILDKCIKVLNQSILVPYNCRSILVGRSVGLLVSWTVGRLVGQLVGRSVSWSVWSVYCAKLIVAHSLRLSIGILAILSYTRLYLVKLDLTWPLKKKWSNLALLCFAGMLPACCQGLSENFRMKHVVSVMHSYKGSGVTSLLTWLPKFPKKQPVAVISL